MLGLLAYRIWTIESNAASIRTSKRNTMMPVLRVVADAALLYSATLFTALICFVNANNGQYVVLDLVNKSDPVHDIISSRSGLTSISPADHADHFHCILHGAHSHRHEATEYRASSINHLEGNGYYWIPGCGSWDAVTTSAFTAALKERFDPTILVWKPGRCESVDGNPVLSAHELFFTQPFCKYYRFISPMTNPDL